MSEINTIIGAGGFPIKEWLKGIMLYTILFSIISLATGAGAVFFAKKKMHLLIRMPAILICSIIFLISTLLASITINGLRIGHGAESFICNMIEEPANHQSLPFSPNVTSDKKTQMLNILRNLPESEYKIELDDVWFELWEYTISFDDGQTFFVVIDAPKTFLRLFTKVDYALYEIYEIKTE